MSERLVIVQASAPWFKQVNGMLAEAGWRALGMSEFEALPRAVQQHVHAGVLMLDKDYEAELDEVDVLMADRRISRPCSGVGGLFVQCQAVPLQEPVF
jgi:hypothetical protein